MVNASIGYTYRSGRADKDFIWHRNLIAAPTSQGTLPSISKTTTLQHIRIGRSYQNLYPSTSLTMDFASLMSAQIAKSKKPAPSPARDSKQSKYLKRSEIEQQRQEAYEAEQRALEEARIAKLEKKRKYEDVEAEKNRVREEKRIRLAEQSRKLREEEEDAEERARRKRLGLPDLPPRVGNASTEDNAIAEGDDIEEEELLQKLRALNEPVKLFGESHANRLRRYRKIVTRNNTPKTIMTKGPIPTSLVPVPEAEMRVPDSIPTDPEAIAFLYRQLASYFDMVLTEWQVALARRDENVKATSAGKAAYNAMLQAKINMVPLFRKLEKSDLEKGILEPVVEIVRYCQERRYVDANDAYLRLSIGKA